MQKRRFEVKTTEELEVFYRDLPQTMILDRKYGIRKFAPEDLDRIGKEQYGETHAKYDAERDCCVITFPRVTEGKSTGGGFWTTIKLGKTT
jgi:hypothetical protein